MALEIVLGKIADYLVIPIGRQIGYLFCYNSNIRNLRDQVTHLEKMRVGIQLSVDAAKRNIEDIGPEVEHWLKEVSKVKDDSDEILERTDEFENGWCPNLISRYSLSKKATKKTQNIGDLKQDGDKYTKLSYPAPPVQTLSISTEIFKRFKSRMETTKELMVALKDDDSNIIGISGMGGVGKTTIVEEVAKMAKNEKLFDEVVMATVSKKQDLFKIQSELAGMLGLSLVRETNPLESAGKLRERLSNVQRSLVILDDLWEEMDLGKLGIPLGRNGGGHKGCKVVLTSRDEHVCIEMGSQKNFIVEVLSKDEARDLFKEVAGITNDIPELPSIAEKVADECGGLPLAIVTLAKSLKTRNKHSWNHRLRQLRECNGIPEKVKLSIKLSYDVLTGEAKSLLLLCSLFPEDYDIPIECLVRYGFGLRLFKPIVTVAAARDWVYSLIDELRSCYLILAGDEENVKLHDVVRDVCVSIASQPEHAYLVRCDVGLEEWPQEGAYEHYTTISLMFNKIKELPTGLDCPNLKLLQLECRDQARSEDSEDQARSENSEDHARSEDSEDHARSEDSEDHARSKDSELCPSGDFFEGMKELRVFVLRSMLLQLPPSPLNSLMQIRTLCLDFCKFRTNNISTVGSLKSLEILSFFNSEIVQLPIEIGQLGHLKVLDLRCALDLKILPGILSKLVKLEELYMTDSLAEWVMEQGIASITELNSLSNLTTLKIVMSPADLLKLMGFCFANLRRFEVEIAPENVNTVYRPTYYGLKNRLVLSHCDILKLSEIGIIVLLGQCETIELHEIRGMGTNLFCQLDEKDFLTSQKLVVRNCKELEYLTCSNLRAETFGQLQELSLSGLSAMKCLFPPSVVKCLVQLRKLEVYDCSSLEYVMTNGEDEKDKGRILFPKLNFLSVQNLPRLRSIYPNPYILTKNGLFHEEVQVLMPTIETLFVIFVDLVEYIVDCHMEAGQANSFQSLQLLLVGGCEDLTAVFDFEGPEVRGEHVQVTLGQLKLLHVRYSPMLMHIWRMAPKELKGFQNLRSLTIWSCENMIYVLPLTVAKLLINLRELDVRDCEMLEEIIEPEQDCSEIKDVEEIVTKKGGEEMVMEKIVFPQLSKLNLVSLTNLTGFCSSKFELEFPSLTRLWIEDCGKMKTFCSGPVYAPKFPNLDRVDCSASIDIR